MIDTNDATAIVTVGLLALIPAIETLRGWFGGGQKRKIQSPLVVKGDPEFARIDHQHSEYMLREQHERIAAACDEKRRNLEMRAQQEREALHLQIAGLGKDIRTELFDHNAKAEERASLIHSRINGIAEPVSALKARVEDHIHDGRAHTKGTPS